jgi:hypothetical protein
VLLAQPLLRGAYDAGLIGVTLFCCEQVRACVMATGAASVAASGEATARPRVNHVVPIDMPPELNLARAAHQGASQTPAQTELVVGTEQHHWRQRRRRRRRRWWQ